MKNEYEIRGDVTAIFIKRKDGTIHETIIDTADLEKADQYSHSWFVSYNKATKSFYVWGNLGKRTSPKSTAPRGRSSLGLHRWLTDCPDDMQVDHINHDTLDNRRSVNLRNVTQEINQQNRRVVNVYKHGDSWSVNIRINGKQAYMGIFKTEEEAIEYSKKVRAIHYPGSEEARNFQVVAIEDAKGKAYKNKKYSRTRNIYYNKSSDQWSAVVYKDKKSFNLGCFKTEEEAERVVELAKEKLKNGESIEDMTYLHKPRSTSTSGVRGVTWDKKARKWKVQISKKDWNVNEWYDDLEDAGKAAREIYKKIREAS